MSTTRNFGDRCTTVDQVPRCLVLHCHSEFVLHSLRNVEPVQVGVEQLWQTTVELPRSSDETCNSIQHTLQLVSNVHRRTSQDSVAVIHSGGHEGVDQYLRRLGVD